jgi:DedD protein
MAKAATDEQLQLRRRARRRLIGALALVTLIAVVLPWILESEPKQSDQEISIQIPSSSDSGTFTSRVVPGRTREPLDAGVDASAQSPAEGKPKPTHDPESSATEAQKKSSDHRESTAAGKQFVVQISALIDAAKASAMQRALAAKGLKSYTEVVKTPSGDVTRVRVGPFPNRESAEQERAKLKALGFNGNVAPR